MKKQLYILLTGLLIILVSACKEDFLDVTNKNAPSTSNYYTQQSEIEEALVSAYAVLAQRGMYGVELHLCLYGADEGVEHEFPVYDRLMWDNSIASGVMLSAYNHPYRGIFRCNLILDKIENKELKLKPEDKNKIIGQALFLRALYNFHVATLYGTPPLVKKVVNVGDLYGNSKPGEVYQAAVDDLRRVINENMLPKKKDWPETEMGRATIGAANALLGKVYLYMQKWDSAAYYLNNVIKSGEYKLVMPQGTDSADYVCAFLSNFSPTPLTYNEKTYGGENNEESVFEVQFNDDAGQNQWLPGWQCGAGMISAYFNFRTGYNNIAGNDRLADEFRKEKGPDNLTYDPRLCGTLYQDGDEYPFKGKINIYNAKTTAFTKFKTNYSIKKYYYPPRSERDGYVDPNNWRLMRYADVLVMFAEAKTHTNPNDPDALAAINEVRARSGMAPLVAPLTKEAIIHERYVEFAAEITHYHDLVRWSLLTDGPWVNPADYNPYFEKGKHEYFPYPQSEIDLMKGELKQNPGW